MRMDYYPNFTTTEEWNTRNREEDRQEAERLEKELLEKYKDFPWAKEALEAGWAPPNKVKELEDKIEELHYDILEVGEY